MKIKDFFKSNAFKCVYVLLGIVLVCSVLLTICNSLFYVSDEEKLSRAIAKIYGKTVEYTQLNVNDDFNDAKSQINSVYKIETYQGEYLINATGKDGYQGGTVTVWVLIDTTNEQVKVKKATIAGSSGQSYLNKIDAEDLQTLINKQDQSGFTDFDVDGISTGATRSLTAISNALNGATAYANTVITEGQDE